LSQASFGIAACRRATCDLQSESGVVIMNSSLDETPAGTPASADSDSQAQRHTRRRVVAVGAGVSAAAALAAVALPGKREPETQAANAANGRKPTEGYRLTEHIRRYYETTRS
jgi:hypothetical protein